MLIRLHDQTDKKTSNEYVSDTKGIKNSNFLVTRGYSVFKNFQFKKSLIIFTLLYFSQWKWGCFRVGFELLRNILQEASGAAELVFLRMKTELLNGALQRLLVASEIGRHPVVQQKKLLRHNLKKTFNQSFKEKFIAADIGSSQIRGYLQILELPTWI